MSEAAIENLIALAGKVAGFSNPSSLSAVQISPDYRNKSYRLTDGQTAVLLRRHQAGKTCDDIDWESRVIAEMENRQVPTPKMFTYWQGADGLYSLYEWLNVDDSGGIASDPPLYEAGELLAKIHLTPLKSLGSHYYIEPLEARLHQRVGATNPCADQTLSELLVSCSWNAQLLHDLWLLQAISKRVGAAAPRTLSGEPRTCLLHGDYNARNLLRDTCLLYVIDWEDAFIGDAAWDIAKAITYLCGFPENDIRQPQSCAFLSGYQRLTPLPSTDLDRILAIARYVVATDLSWLQSCLIRDDPRQTAFAAHDYNRLRKIELFGDDAIEAVIRFFYGKG